MTGNFAYIHYQKDNWLKTNRFKQNSLKLTKFAKINAYLVLYIANLDILW